MSKATGSSCNMHAQRPEAATCGTVAAIGVCMGVFRIVFSFTTADD